MPFDDVHGFPPVAVPANERHDAATCRGERQEPDVGEGWVGLGPDEILQADDECDVGGNCRQWVPTLRAGQRVGIEDTYRRRVTPDERPLGAFLDEENNTLRAENATLRSEVERLRLRDHEPETLGTAEHIVRLAGFTQTADDIATIAARLGGGK